VTVQGSLKLRKAAAWCVAWSPLFVVWALFTLNYVRKGILDALLAALITTGTAAILGIFVWKFTERVPWPEHLSLRFYAIHIVAAIAYAILWCGLLYGWTSLIAKVPFWETITHSRILAWQILTGSWLYGLVAGVAYSTGIRERLTQKEIAAHAAEAAAAAARLEALRARLHPHFLFNALHTVSALIRFDPPAAERAVERLADLLRYSLRDSASELVDFEDELDFVKQYVSFEQLRFSDRFKISFVIGEGCVDYQLPIFCIQTLVENAVQHSVAVRPEGGTVCIDCQSSPDGLRVVVHDDGPNMTETRVSEFSHQSGLKALSERLRTHYGTAATLQTQREETGFTSTLRIPTEGASHMGRS